MYMEQLERRKLNKDRKEYRVTVQVSEREKELLKILATEEGLTVSDYIRRICLYIPHKNIFGSDY